MREGRVLSRGAHHHAVAPENRSESTRFAGPVGKPQSEGTIFFAAPRAYFDAANVCITIFPLRTTKVSVANGNYGLASHTM